MSIPLLELRRKRDLEVREEAWENMSVLVVGILCGDR